MSLQSSTTRLESRNWREGGRREEGGGRRNFGIPFPHPGGTNLTQSMQQLPWNANYSQNLEQKFKLKDHGIDIILKGLFTNFFSTVQISYFR